MNKVKGLHHITAVAGDPQQNIDFYMNVLGQRLIKKTVNFDDPGTYHFYYANRVGELGTVMTFFPWKHMKRGTRGNGETGASAYMIAPDSYDYWRTRLTDFNLAPTESERFEERVLSFKDPDDMTLELITDAHAPTLAHWENSPVPAEHALRGFHSASLWLGQKAATGKVLELLGYENVATETDPEGERHRYRASSNTAAYVDLVIRPQRFPGQFGAGSVHHIAFRTEDDKEQLEYLEFLREHGLNVTPVQDRQYFHSIYFREPGGVLFEIATDAPGFLYDEAEDELGKHLKLPDWYDPNALRLRLECKRLPIQNMRHPDGNYAEWFKFRSS